jgi:hypothetical protein
MKKKFFFILFKFNSFFITLILKNFSKTKIKKNMFLKKKKWIFNFLFNIFSQKKNRTINLLLINFFFILLKKN